MSFWKMNSIRLLTVALFCTHLKLARSASSCCPDLGCYTDDPPYQNWPPPRCPEEMGVTMTLYTRRNPTEGQPISRTSIPSAFDGDLMTIYVVHGWLNFIIFQHWPHELKDAALSRGDFNVIIVDWTLGSMGLYNQVASNTRTVGGEIALVANNTINQAGSSQSRLYCVGHSLGSHICGIAGQRRKFGRITGLDPAGPEFEARDLSAGLNPSCADLVDVIHTDSKAFIGVNLGIKKTLGHVDFYPNGGGNQPGCIIDSHVDPEPLLKWLLNDVVTEENGTTTLNVDLTLFCSHFRSYAYYIESLKNPCFWSRYKCSSNNFDLLLLSCKYRQDPYQSLGFADKEYGSRGIFYLETNSASPFCLD